MRRVLLALTVLLVVAPAAPAVADGTATVTFPVTGAPTISVDGGPATALACGDRLNRSGAWIYTVVYPDRDRPAQDECGLEITVNAAGSVALQGGGSPTPIGIAGSLDEGRATIDARGVALDVVGLRGSDPPTSSIPTSSLNVAATGGEPALVQTSASELELGVSQFHLWRFAVPRSAALSAGGAVSLGGRGIRRGLGLEDLALSSSEGTATVDGEVAIPGALRLQAAGAITQTRPIAAATVVATSRAGVALTSGSNVIGTVSGGAGGPFAVTTFGPLSVGAVDATGQPVALTASGALVQDDGTIKASALTAAGTSVALERANEIASATLNTDRGSAALGAATSFTLAGGSFENLSAQSDGTLTTSGALTASSSLSLSAESLTLGGEVDGATVEYAVDGFDPAGHATTGAVIAVPTSALGGVNLGGSGAAGLDLPPSTLALLRTADLRIGRPALDAIHVRGPVDRGTGRLSLVADRLITDDGGAANALTARTLSAQAGTVSLTGGGHAVDAVSGLGRTGAFALRTTRPLEIAAAGVQASSVALRTAGTLTIAAGEVAATSGDVTLTATGLDLRSAVRSPAGVTVDGGSLPVRLGPAGATPVLALEDATLDRVSAATLSVVTASAEPIDVAAAITLGARTLRLVGAGVTGAGSLSADALQLAGTRPAAWSVTGAAAGLASGPVTLDGVRTLSITGSDGADTFDVRPGAGPEVVVDGGAPATVPGDVLTYQAGRRAVIGAPTTPSGALARTGSFSVRYADVERVVVADPPTAALQALTLSSGSLSPAFDPATGTYAAAVGADVAEVTVTAVPEDLTASVSVDGVAGGQRVVGLAPGESRSIAIAVRADGVASTTTVVVTRARPAAVPDAPPARDPVTPAEPPRSPAPASVLSLELPAGTSTVFGNPVLDGAAGTPLACRLTGRVLTGCTAALVLARDLRRPRRIGRGTQVGTADRRGDALAVRLNATGRRLLRGRPLGFGAVLRVTGVAADGTSWTAERRVRILGSDHVDVRTGPGVARRLARVAVRVPRVATLTCTAATRTRARSACDGLRDAGTQAATVRVRGGGDPGVLRIAFRR